MKIVLRALLAASFVLSAAPSFAQSQQQPPAPPKPDVVKQEGDWLVRCYPVNTPTPCDMFELLAQKQTGNRVMSLSFAYAPKADKYIVQIAVPLGVSLAQGLTIKAGSYTSPKLQFRRCDRGGCYIEGLTDAALLDGLAQSTDAAKAVIGNEEGRPLDVSFSLKGFGEARTAMTDLAKQKATAAPAQKPAH